MYRDVEYTPQTDQTLEKRKSYVKPVVVFGLGIAASVGFWIGGNSMRHSAEQKATESHAIEQVLGDVNDPATRADNPRLAEKYDSLSNEASTEDGVGSLLEIVAYIVGGAVVLDGTTRAIRSVQAAKPPEADNLPIQQ